MALEPDPRLVLRVLAERGIVRVLVALPDLAAEAEVDLAHFVERNELQRIERALAIARIAKAGDVVLVAELVDARRAALAGSGRRSIPGGRTEARHEARLPHVTIGDTESGAHHTSSPP